MYGTVPSTDTVPHVHTTIKLTLGSLGLLMNDIADRRWLTQNVHEHARRLIVANVQNSSNTQQNYIAVSSDRARTGHHARSDLITE